MGSESKMMKYFILEFLQIFLRVEETPFIVLTITL